MPCLTDSLSAEHCCLLHWIKTPMPTKNIHLQLLTHIQAAYGMPARNWSLLLVTRMTRTADTTNRALSRLVRLLLCSNHCPPPGFLQDPTTPQTESCLFQHLETGFCSNSCILQEAWRKVMAAGLCTRLSHSSACYRTMMGLILISSYISPCKLPQAEFSVCKMEVMAGFHFTQV